MINPFIRQTTLSCCRFNFVARAASSSASFSSCSNCTIASRGAFMFFRRKRRAYVSVVASDHHRPMRGDTSPRRAPPASRGGNTRTALLLPSPLPTASRGERHRLLIPECVCGPTLRTLAPIIARTEERPTGKGDDAAAVMTACPSGPTRSLGGSNSDVHIVPAWGLPRHSRSRAVVDVSTLDYTAPTQCGGSSS